MLALLRHAQMRKKGLVDMEAEEEEEEEFLQGLEDFGFGAVGPSAKEKKEKDKEENENVEVREDDFENIVDTVSDDEGDDGAFAEFAVQKVSKHNMMTTIQVSPAI